MESGNEKTPQSIDSIESPAFKEALQKQSGFMARLEGAQTYDDIIYAVEKAAVTDDGEEVVFDIEGYESGYEDEDVEATTVPLAQLKSAIEFIRDNGVPHADEIRNLVENIHVTNAIKGIWVRELPLTEEQIIPEIHE
jgi:hypothetical protein